MEHIVYAARKVYFSVTNVSYPWEEAAANGWRLSAKT